MTRRQLSSAALNVLFVLLFLAPAPLLPALLLIFPLLAWKRTGRLSLLYLILFPLAILSQMFTDRVDLVELIRVIEIVGFLVCVGRYQVEGRIAPASYLCIMAVIVTFSLADLFKIGALTNLKQHIWPVAVAKNWDYGGIVNISWFRLGSIYYNPSVLAQAVTLLMAFILLNKRWRLTLLMLPVIGALVMLSGSRTAMAIYAAQLVWFLLLSDDGTDAISRTSRKFVVISALAGAVVVTVLATGLDLSTFRGLDFKALVSRGESAQTKALSNARYVSDLIRNESPRTLWYVAFGQGKIDLAHYQLDSELGYLIFAFGVFGSLIIAVRIFGLMRMAWRASNGSVNLLWLWSIGASTLFSFRFLLIVLLMYSIAGTGRRPLIVAGT